MMRNLLRGFNADGRALGLGLATAMAEQRRKTAREVEDYLRDQPVSEDVTTASV